jgi:hypothetical protein
LGRFASARVVADEEGKGKGEEARRRVRAAATLTRSESSLCSALALWMDARTHGTDHFVVVHAAQITKCGGRAGGRALEERIQDRHGNEALAPRMGGAGERKQSKASELRKRGVGIARRSGADPRPRATWVQRAGRGGRLDAVSARICLFLTIIWGIECRHVGCSTRARKGRGPCLRLAPADKSNTGRRRF